MREILWFRRDLRINDSAILAHAKDEVLPIFIFDTNILSKLPKEDKRVCFIYQSVLHLKKQLQEIGLDLAIFYGNPKEIFSSLRGFDRVLCSVDFDDYSINRDQEIEKIIPMSRFYDSYLIEPKTHLKKDGTPYRVFTPFYNALEYLWQSDKIELFHPNLALKKIPYDYNTIPSLEDMGFKEQSLPLFLTQKPHKLLEEFSKKIQNYQHDRDYFHLDGTSKLSVHLRFGLISPREIFNFIKRFKGSDFFIRELFWREFYSYILFHFPKSEFENFNHLEVEWEDNEDDFKAWCDGNTGVPIIDASMRYLNLTGLMHNRLRMVVSSFLTKNLLIDWRWGERYFALKLLDYDASSNIGSWQWASSTGADSVPYFRIFNPYLQSQKWDKEAIFIKSVLKELQEVEAKTIHIEGGVQNSLFINYPQLIVKNMESKKRAIERFEEAKSPHR
ncbi:MAG: deoxyribodipyrimidine photo-lyase [Epsilonproteobacteria bacterium]|nr:deoxyribodipyrimidine photo-lyase [Campylobacterota bacterium]MBD3839191.1 deoxyribodipyrimidine photo-lyase [Campylobacterota bacterium]